MKNQYKVLVALVLAHLLVLGAWAQPVQNKPSNCDINKDGESPVNLKGDFCNNKYELKFDLGRGATKMECEIHKYDKEDEQKYVNVTVGFKNPNTSITVKANNTVYSFLQFHFHNASEHAIGGNKDSMEVHFVFKNLEKGKEKDKLVCGILIKADGRDNTFFEPVLNALKQTLAGNHPELEINLSDLGGKMGLDKYMNTYYNYNGSLTSPPFSTDVNWFVSANKLTISKRQLEDFKKLIYKYENGKRYRIGIDRKIHELDGRPIRKK